jgi:hypothetical protein
MDPNDTPATGTANAVYGSVHELLLNMLAEKSEIDASLICEGHPWEDTALWM